MARDPDPSSSAGLSAFLVGTPPSVSSLQLSLAQNVLELWGVLPLGFSL